MLVINLSEAVTKGIGLRTPQLLAQFSIDSHSSNVLFRHNIRPHDKVFSIKHK